MATEQNQIPTSMYEGKNLIRIEMLNDSVSKTWNKPNYRNFVLNTTAFELNHEKTCTVWPKFHPEYAYDQIITTHYSTQFPKYRNWEMFSRDVSYILALATTILVPSPMFTAPGLVHVSLNCSSVTPAKTNKQTLIIEVFTTKNTIFGDVYFGVACTK
jgi:hypothetical protein